MEGAGNTGAALAGVVAALESIDHGARAHLSAAERLDLVEAARRASSRLEALAVVLVGEADATNSAMIALGTPTASWLALSGQTAGGEARALVASGLQVTRRPSVQQAALDGRVTTRQACSITRVLAELPPTFTDEQTAAAEAFLLQRAGTTSADRLAGLAATVIAEILPEPPGPEADQRRLEAQARRAHGRRYVSFRPDGDGSILIRGSLPILAAAPLMALVDAHTERERRSARDLRDPQADWTTSAQRRADALVAIVAGGVESGPTTGGAGPVRPRVVVTMSYEQLVARVEQAGVLPEGHQIPAGDLRRLACDAGILPIVLGGPSEVLDLGTTRRLVTPGLRRALEHRDSGCVVPGCAVPVQRCEAHHLQPWWAGGPTSLANLVLLCGHHHALVEPPRFWTDPPPDRWVIRLDARGRPEVLPPHRLDPQRKPIPRAGSRSEPAA